MLQPGVPLRLAKYNNVGVGGGGGGGGGGGAEGIKAKYTNIE